MFTREKKRQKQSLDLTNVVVCWGYTQSYRRGFTIQTAEGSPPWGQMFGQKVGSLKISLLQEASFMYFDYVG